MTEEQRLRLDRLAGMAPPFAHTVTRLLRAMDALGAPMFVTDGGRTTEQQAALYAQGRTTPGAIVTKADGVKNRSNHQEATDGFFHAVDCAFIGPKPWAESHPWALYGAIAKALGVFWGGDWASPDRPHISDRKG